MNNVMPKSVIRKLLGMNDPLNSGLGAKQTKEKNPKNSQIFHLPNIYTYLKIEINTCQPNIKMVETIIKELSRSL